MVASDIDATIVQFEQRDATCICTPENKTRRHSPKVQSVRTSSSSRTEGRTSSICVQRQLNMLWCCAHLQGRTCDATIGMHVQCSIRLIGDCVGHGKVQLLLYRTAADKSTCAKHSETNANHQNRRSLQGDGHPRYNPGKAARETGRQVACGRKTILENSSLPKPLSVLTVQMRSRVLEASTSRTDHPDRGWLSRS